MMNVCLISRRFYPVVSGMSTYAYNLAEQYVRLGHRLTVVAQYRAAADNVYRDGPPIAMDGIRVLGRRQLGEEANGDFERDIDELAETVCELHAAEPFDILHAQFAYPPGLAALRAGRAKGIPVVVSIQGGDGHWFGTCCTYHHAVLRAILTDADAVVVGSDSFADEVRTNSGLPAPLTILHGGVNVHRFRPADADERARLRRVRSWPADRLVVLYHGRIDRRKGLEELLDAFTAVCGYGSAPLLAFSGIGPDDAWLARAVTLRGLTADVCILGHVGYEESADVYRAADIFCSPTYGEGFSNTITEAMATALPIVSTRVPGVVDALEDGRTGLLVDSRSAAALADALRRLLDEPETRRRLGAAAREEVVARFDWSRVADGLLGIYEEVRQPRQPRSEWAIAQLEHLERDACRFRVSPQLL